MAKEISKQIIGYFNGGSIELCFYSNDVRLYARWSWMGRALPLVVLDYGQDDHMTELGSLQLIEPPKDDRDMGWFWLSLTEKERKEFIYFIQDTGKVLSHLWNAQNKLLATTLYWGGEGSAFPGDSRTAINGILDRLSKEFQTECLIRMRRCIDKKKARLHLAEHRMVPVKEIDSEILEHQKKIEELTRKKTELLTEALGNGGK